MMCDPSTTIDSELADEAVAPVCHCSVARNLRRRRRSVELRSGIHCHLGIIDSDSKKHCVCDPRGLIGHLPCSCQLRTLPVGMAAISGVVRKPVECWAKLGTETSGAANQAEFPRIEERSDWRRRRTQARTHPAFELPP